MNGVHVHRLRSYVNVGHHGLFPGFIPALKRGGFDIIHAHGYRQPQSDAAWNQITSFLKSVFAGEWKKERAIWRFEADTSVSYDFASMKRWE